MILLYSGLAEGECCRIANLRSIYLFCVNEIKLDFSCENPPKVTEELEIKTEITVDKSSEQTTPETIVSEPLVEAVTEVVPSEIDYQTR